jgi:uncharacterized membrane protein
MSPDAIARAYRRLLLWYPSEWRANHGEAMLGTLLDQADAEGRTRVTASDRIGLVVGGIRERLRESRRPSRPNIVALAAATALSLFYLTIIWAPGIRYAGTAGPFSNPSVITCALLFGALALTLAARPRMARLLLVASIVVELSIGILSQRLAWLGPSWYTVILFTGLALLSLWPLRRLSSAAAMVGALILIAGGATLIPTAWNALSDLGPWAIAAATVAVMLIVLIIGWSARRIHRVYRTSPLNRTR